MLCSSITGSITERVISRGEMDQVFLLVTVSELQCELGRKQFLKAVKLILTAGISARVAANYKHFIKGVKKILCTDTFIHTHILFTGSFISHGNKVFLFCCPTFLQLQVTVHPSAWLVPCNGAV